MVEGLGCHKLNMNDKGKDRYNDPGGGGGAQPRKVRVCENLGVLWRGVFPISAGLKKGGLLFIAYPYTFSIGVPPPRDNDIPSLHFSVTSQEIM